MVHVNLTITGEIDEVVHIIRSLAPQGAGFITPPVVDPRPEPEPTLLPAVSAPADYIPIADPETPAETNADWTPAKATTLMNGVNGDATLVLLYLARRNPPQATPDQITADLALQPRQLTNALISVGNRASRNNLPMPAVLKKGGTLRIENTLAQALTSSETEADDAGAPQSQRNAEWFDFSR